MARGLSFQNNSADRRFCGGLRFVSSRSGPPPGGGPGQPNPSGRLFQGPRQCAFQIQTGPLCQGPPQSAFQIQTGPFGRGRHQAPFKSIPDPLAGAAAKPPFRPKPDPLEGAGTTNTGTTQPGAWPRAGCLQFKRRTSRRRPPAGRSPGSSANNPFNTRITATG